MRLTTIRSEQIYLEMMETAPAERERIYRARLIKPFAFKWACVGIPLTAKEEGGCDVVSAAAMNSFYAPTQITDVRRRAEIECIRSDTFWAACEKSIRDTLFQALSSAGSLSPGRGMSLP